MRYFVVSDIHSYFTELMNALNEKGFDETNNNHKLVVCGDLMDRGDESYELQQYIMRLINNDKAILIRGNHEDLMMDLLNKIEEYYEYIVFTHHCKNRTVHTALDLTGKEMFDIVSNPNIFVQAVKETPYVKEIIPRMLDYFETNNYIFVHGWIPCKKSGEMSQPLNYDKDWRKSSKIDWEEARWLNGMDCANLWDIVEPKKTIVCGHWHCSYGHAYFNKKDKEKSTLIKNKKLEFSDEADFSPYFGEGIIAIDSCVAFSGKINCLVLDD